MYSHKVTYSFPNNTPNTDVDVIVSVRDGADKDDALVIAGNSLLVLDGGKNHIYEPRVVEGEKFHNAFSDILDMLTKHIEDMKWCTTNYDWEKMKQAISELEITKDAMSCFLPVSPEQVKALAETKRLLGYSSEDVQNCTGNTTTCPVDECMVCSIRDCPHGEPLHYHHDGCPACYKDQTDLQDSSIKIPETMKIRKWPCGTEQHLEEDPYSWMSDDFEIVEVPLDHEI